MPNRLPTRRLDRRRVRYPRLVCDPELTPLRDVEWLGAGVNLEGQQLAAGEVYFQWRSTSENPQFLLRGAKPLAGWNMLEIMMTHDQHRAAVRVYFDTGEGYNEEQSIFLPMRQDKMTKRICFVPYGTRSIRLDPLESEGRFAFSHLRLVWLTPRFAYDRMARRLCSVHPQYRDLSTRNIIRALKDEAREDGLRWKMLAAAHYEETFMHRSPENHYRYWLDHVEPLREPNKRQATTRLAQLSQQPLISLLLPVCYGSSAERLTACVESVLAQRYGNWQLCIAGASGDREIHAAIERLVALDERIQVVDCEAPSSAAASNAALAMAHGNYVALLSPDDRLAVNALYHVAETLNRHPEAELLYGDEDKLDDEGHRYDPHFKPQWNPDLLLAQNYIGHLTVYHRARLRDFEGFCERGEADPSYELILRFTRGVTAERIRHIPFVLYHSRVVASDGEAAAQVAADRPSLCAVRAYLTQIGTGAEVMTGTVPGSCRVRWPLPSPAPLVSLLIPTRDRVEILRPCVDAILARTDYPNFELLILDNQSTCAETLAYMAEVAKDPRVRVLSWNQPFNYSAINNFGARQARGRILGLVNNDIEPINDDWLSEMVRQVCREEIGCVGAKLYYPNGSIQHGGVILGLGGVAGHAHRFFPGTHSGYRYRLNLTQNLSAVTAACLLIRRTVFEEVDGLNEEYLSVAYNDVDLCLKVREAGYRNLWTPHAELYHHESVSRGVDDNSKKQARAQRETDYMRRTWGPQLDSDPAYNPNLTLAYEDFSLR